jgi:uncharacterized protein YndB with AHSA1/START domain
VSRAVIRAPDLTGRPYGLNVEHVFGAPPAGLYAAWTEHFDVWFAARGSVLMRAEVDEPFFFETEFKTENESAAKRYPHYGRFLRLTRNALIELTWVTGAGGTEGAETVVTVELQPASEGTRLCLSHAGFATEAARDRHRHAWPLVLEHLERQIGSIPAI